MNIAEAIRIALLSLWANKLRSVLTLLGVVIGVAAVIAVVTFVNGINGYVAEKIFNLGTNVFIIGKTPNVVTDVDQFIEAQKRKDMTMDQYQAVAEGCDACKIVGASIRQFNGKVVSGTQSSTELPMPSRYRRKITTNPAAFGATDSQATNGVLAAS